MTRRILFAILASTSFALAERSSREDDANSKPSTPEQQRAMFHLPPGFEIQFVASEPDIQKPMNLNFDAAGRLWVTGSEMYPWPAKVDALGQPIAGFDETWKSMSGAFDPKLAPQPSERARDTVRVLSDFAPDGRARTIDVFADALNIPIGIQPLPRKPGAKGDSAIVFSIPKIWRLTDTDGDGRADLREPLYGDFGFRDTHGMSSNYLYWIDGWIYGCHGFANHSVVRDGAGRTTEMNSGNTYRFRPDGSRFELYTHGQTNPFGLAVDDWGNFYSADSHSRPVMLLLPGAHYAGIGKTHDGLGFAPTIMDHDHGSSAIAGLAWYGADHFPPEFRGNTFNGNPVTRRINRDRYEWHGSTPRAIEMPDFLTCDDPWFRPVQVKLGPDGALWIADFYTPIIGHYEQPLADPRRDHAHGRIWRIVWRGENADAPPADRVQPGSTGGPPVAPGGPPGASRGEKTSPLAPATASSRPSVSGEPPETTGQRPVLPHALPIPDLTQLDAKALIEKLGDANITTRMLAHHEIVARRDKFADPAIWKSTLRVSQSRPDQQTRRFPFTAMAERPSNANLAFLIAAVERTTDDPALAHAIRIALRETLSLDGAYEMARAATAQETAGATLLADVSLAVPTAESARFLLDHLTRTKLATPRAGEYLRHAVRHLPEDDLGEVTVLFEHTAPSGFGLADALSQAARERGWKMPDKLAAWTRQTVLAALDGRDIDRAIAALREVQWPEKFAPLEKIVLDQKSVGAKRAAALEAVMNLDGGMALAARALADSSSHPLRKKAAELLGRTSSDMARAALLAALPTAPAELALAITASLVKTDPDCAALLDLLEAGKASAAPLRNRLIQILVTHRSGALRARIDELTKNLPPEDVRLDKVIAERVKAFASAKPDAARGAQVFAQQCAVCHRFRDGGGNVGPNLDGVAARGVHRLIEDVLDPNRNVDPTFRQTALELADGRVLIGVNLREEGGALLLTDAAGQTQSAPTASVKARTQSALSLMPPGFESTIPADDFHALLAYLLSNSKP